MEDSIKPEPSLEERLKLVSKVTDHINKQRGEYTAVIPGSAPGDLFATNSFSTGIISFDMATLVGGIPRGTIAEFYGPPSGCKSLVAYKTIAQTQKKGGIVILADAERSYTPEWGAKHGINNDHLILLRSRTAQEYADDICAYLRSAPIDLVVIDSVSALLPKKIDENSADTNITGALALAMSILLNKISVDMYNNKMRPTSIIFINQIRDQMGGMMGKGSFGAVQYKTTGGRALPHYAKLRIEFRSGEPIKKGNHQIGYEVNGLVKKSKVSSARNNRFKFRFLNGIGIDLTNELIETAKLYGVLTMKGGGVYYIADDPKPVARGRDALYELLESSEEMRNKVDGLVRQFIGATANEDNSEGDED